MPLDKEFDDVRDCLPKQRVPESMRHSGDCGAGGGGEVDSGGEAQSSMTPGD